MKAYDAALADIMKNGWDLNNDRTNEGCRTIFGQMGKYDISERVPVMTFRKVVWQSFVKEVLWYISGSDNIHDLQKSGCNVWAPWIDDTFTENNKFGKGSIGFGYGPNLINFGDNAPDTQHLSERKGFNQLDYVINTLKQNPASRQAMFVLWRPDKINNVLLPACHFAYHFTVSPDKNGTMNQLTCSLFQRSADFAVGVPANLFMATIFTKLIALELNMVPKELIHMSSHSHVYLNALDQAEEYLERSYSLPVRVSPIINIKKANSIYNYTIDNFTIEEYDPYPSIKMPIAI
jgi:thymidylate synthase